MVMEISYVNGEFLINNLQQWKLESYLCCTYITLYTVFA
jgi:hypothetical protein